MSILVIAIWVLVLASPVFGQEIEQPGGGGGGGGGAPTGPCGGDLSGTYPNCLVVGTNGTVIPTASDYTYLSGGGFQNGSLGTGLINNSGTLNFTQAFHDISGSGTAIVTGDLSKTVELGAFTYTLAQAGGAGFGAGWGTCTINIGSGAATINATTSIFKGASGTTALILQPGDWACLSSNGADYITTVGHYRSTIPLAISYSPGINPNGIPVSNISQARTIVGIRCNPEVLAGGTATISVYKAPSGTAISAGTNLTDSTSCNANSSATTDQTLATATSANWVLAPGDRLGLVTTGTTIWTSSGVAAGVVTVFVQ